MASDKAELRQLLPVHLLQALDGIAMAKGMDRTAYIERVLFSDVKQVIHESMVVARVMRGNPLMSDATGGATE